MSFNLPAMKLEYYNLVNQLPLVNNWCVAIKLYTHYTQIFTSLIDNINIAKMYFRYGFDHMNEGMAISTMYGRVDVVKFFIKLGANDWDWGMENAIIFNQLFLIKFFINKGAEVYNWYIVSSIRRGNLDVVKYFIDAYNITNWNQCVIHAAEGGQLELVKFFIEKGANNYQECYELSFSFEIDNYIQQFL
jgi:hypothetical protein